jgi:acetyl esterase
MHVFDPEIAAYLDRAAAAPPREDLSLDDLRAGYRQSLIAESAAIDTPVETRDFSIEDEAGLMAARLYVPDAAVSRSAALLYVHGGGFAVGGIDSHDPLMRLIASESALRVILFDYRLAPEHPFPAGRDDSIRAWEWLGARADDLDIDIARTAIGGESAGAAHAVAATLHLRDTGAILPAALWLMSPALDATTSGQSYADFASGTGRTADEFRYLWSLYAPNADDRATASVSPLLANPARLPPCYIYPAEFDPARDDGEAFAAKAKAAGVEVTLERRAGMIHQYPELTGVSQAARHFVAAGAQQLARALSI